MAEEIKQSWDVMEVGREIEALFKSKGWDFYGSGGGFGVRDMTLITPAGQYIEFTIEDMTDDIKENEKEDEAFEAGKAQANADIDAEIAAEKKE